MNPFYVEDTLVSSLPILVALEASSENHLLNFMAFEVGPELG